MSGSKISLSASQISSPWIRRGPPLALKRAPEEGQTAAPTITMDLQRAPSWEGASSKLRETPRRLAPLPSAPTVQAQPPVPQSTVQTSIRNPTTKKRRRRATLPELQQVPALPKPAKRASTARTVLLGAPKAIASEAGSTERKVQIPKKLFNLVHAIFIEHDEDGDGIICQEEFVRAVAAMNERDDGSRRKVRPSHSEVVGKHALDMYQSALRKSIRGDGKGITLASFCAMYFSHLPFHEVERACMHYTYRPPTPTPRETTVGDIEGAQDEIKAIFDALDTDHDGLVRMKSLEPMLQRIGISTQEVSEWLEQLPSRPGVQRTLSKIDAMDLESIMAPSYIARVEGPAKNLTMEELKRQHEWNEEIYMQLISAH